MTRRLERLTLDNLADLPESCASCTFWELDAVRRRRAELAGEGAGEKQAWVSQVLLDWGSCGRVAYVDGEPAGYVLYAPPTYLPGADAFATSPVSEDAVLLATAVVAPQHAEAGLGRMLMQAVVKDLIQRGGIRALEAFGRPGPSSSRGERGRQVAVEQGTDDRPGAGPVDRADLVGGCLLPTDFLLGVGFRTHRSHARHPRMRLELKSAVTWRDEVEGALEKLLGAVRPARLPVAGPTSRARRGSEEAPGPAG